MRRDSLRKYFDIYWHAGTAIAPGCGLPLELCDCQSDTQLNWNRPKEMTKNEAFVRIFKDA